MTTSATTNATITKTYKNGPNPTPVDDTVSEAIAVHKFETAHAVVGLEQGMTVNLGKYESAKITVSISIPCYKEEVEQAYTQAQKFVEERLSKEIKELKDLAGSRAFGGGI